VTNLQFDEAQLGLEGRLNGGEQRLGDADGRRAVPDCRQGGKRDQVALKLSPA
jgi:hypothetical protein